MEEQNQGKNSKIIYTEGIKKGIYTGHSVTVIKTKSKNYDNTLQEVNDRICSFRPNVSKEDVARGLWDGKTWDYGQYLTYKSDDPRDDARAMLFKDFKTLVKSAACMRGYQHPSKVRGGTYGDVDDFLNFVVLKLLERRLKQFDPNSTCRELDNWPSYIARTIPQFLILYNKSKFDYEVEAYWPLVKDEKTGEWVQKDFGVNPKYPTEFFDKNTFISVLDRAISQIPEAIGLETDIYMYLLYKKTFRHRQLIQSISNIVNIQIMEEYKKELI